jgi:hypothetical protein
VKSLIKNNKYLHSFAWIISIAFAIQPVHADQLVSAYELLFDEQEAGTDVYSVRFVVTDRYIRINEPDDDSGYVLYDDNDKKIYSVSHYDNSTLVILARDVFNYRAVSKQDKNDVFVDIQLVPGLLPKVTEILRKYQTVVAGQQVITLKNTPEEYQTTCFLYDQVFNDGMYYDKGLPIQEWHSNGRKRILTSYKKIDVSSELFERTEDYREYSLD